MTTSIELLTRFSQAHSPSGSESEVGALVVRELRKLVDDVELAPLGSVIGLRRAARRRGERAIQVPRLLVEAHMDEIGLIVRGIEDGFIRFAAVGSFDPRVLLSQNVVVHGRKPFPGVIGARPPHVIAVEERSRAVGIGDMFIDLGLTDARARELVSVGDAITLDRSVIPLANGRYAAKSFDNRAGLTALVQFLRALRGAELAWDVYAVANVNEEQSALYVGARTATWRIQPQLAVCLDVTHARQPSLHDSALSELGKGPCIARGANIHPLVFERLERAAELAGIPYQLTVYGGDTETNAWAMQVTAGGVPTGLVELPLRYMHTSVETLDLADVEHAAKLLTTFASTLTREDAQALGGERYSRKKERAAPRPNGRAVRVRTARPRARSR